MFIALVNPKSGGNVGNQLLARFKEVLHESRVYNLVEDKGPSRALEEHRRTENLRIIGKEKFEEKFLNFKLAFIFQPAEATEQSVGFFL